MRDFKIIRMNKAGASAPVFLCGERNRFYLDNFLKTEVTIQLSYEEFGKPPVWFTYPVGRLNSDFAFEEFGASAVRLRAVNTGKESVDVQLVVEQLD